MTTTQEQQEAAEKMISEIRKAGVPNNVAVYIESGSIILAFGEFVAEIVPSEIEWYASEHREEADND